MARVRDDLRLTPRGERVLNWVTVLLVLAAFLVGLVGHLWNPYSATPQQPTPTPTFECLTDAECGGYR